MIKKKYVCCVCGQERISRKLPHGWGIRTDGKRPKWMGYVCNACKIRGD